MKEKTTSTVDKNEIEHFSRLAGEWWDPTGKFKPLHAINPLRIGLVRDLACQHFGKDAHAPTPLNGLRLVDIGCGGGLIAEPMCRLGADVVAIDASEKNIKTASVHAQQNGLSIDYRHSTAEALAESGELFDIVLALEIVEHVADVELFLETISALAKPGGMVFCSTINRTVKSYALAIIGAEYVLRWVPIGTHQWKKFLRPSELCRPFRQHGIDITDMRGMVMNPLNGTWHWDDKDLAVNYMVSGIKA
jgi:2-polyprenyl-6-hydroxyphenyl methylase / 3-demethylubiquinone-9 3-methyltransferase